MRRLIFVFLAVACIGVCPRTSWASDDDLDSQCLADFLIAEEAVRALKLLKEISRTLMGHSPLRTALNDVSEIMTRHFGLHGARFWIHDPGSSLLHLVGASANFDQSKSDSIADNLLATGGVLRTRVFYRSNSALSDPLIPQDPWIEHNVIHSYVGIPLLTGDEAVGVIEFFSKTPLGDDVVRIANSIVEEVTLGIEKKRMEWYLLHSKTMDAMKTLSAGLAHQLHNMFTVISGYLELAQLQLSPSHDTFSILAQAFTSTNKALSLTRLLTKFTQVTETKRETFSIGSVVGQTLSNLRTQIPGNVRLVDQLGTHVFHVLGERAKLEEALVHLVQNSLDALTEVPQAQIRVLIDESTPPSHLDLRSGPYVRVQVIDNGRGIAEENQARVFQPFFTTNLAERKGLGLYSVYQLIREHGGGVTFSSRINVGTTFSVYLPMAEPPAELNDRNAAGALLVINDPTLTTMYRLLLETVGLEVHVEPDPAKVAARAANFGIVLTTIPDVVASLAQNVPDLPVIYGGSRELQPHKPRPKNLYVYSSFSGFSNAQEWLRQQLGR